MATKKKTPIRVDVKSEFEREFAPDEPALPHVRVPGRNLAEAIMVEQYGNCGNNLPELFKAILKEAIAIRCELEALNDRR